MTKKNIISAENITVELGGKTILKDVSLEIKDQELVVIIGPSGEGKTVLLKTLAGLIPPAKGIVTIEGENWQEIESEHKHDLSQKLGVLFQQSALFDTMTCLENVMFPILEHHQLDKEHAKKKSIELLNKVNLGDSINKIPSQLSGGMQRRLGIARALALNPLVIFYDDPTAGQDPIQSEQMANLILDLKKKNNSTVIMVSSNMRITYKMADRIFMVIDQEVIDAGTAEQVKQHKDPRIHQFINGLLEGPISL